MKSLLLAAVLAAPAMAADAPPALVPAAEAPKAAEAAPAAEAPKLAAEPAKPAAEAAEAKPAAETTKAEDGTKVEISSPKVVETKPLPSAAKPEAKKADDAAGWNEAIQAAAKGADPKDAEAEWAFVKAAGAETDSALQDAAVDDARQFLRRWPGSAQTPDALLLLADLRRKRGDWQAAMADLLRLIYEYPDAKAALDAKSAYLDLVDKKGSRRQRPPLNELVRAPEGGSGFDRLAALWQTAADKTPDVFYDAAADGIRDFLARDPGHKDADKVQAALARLHAANGKPAAALLAWRKLLALYPDSALRPAALLAVGDLYADSLRDPKKAIDAYQDLVVKYPQAPEILPALEGSARLFEDKLRQYDLAVELDEKIVKGFPKTAASLKALKTIARLQRDKLSKSDDAIKTLMRLSTMHGGQDGVDALQQAADWARRDLKDYARQAELLRKIADDYAAAKEAPEALYDAGYAYENDVKDYAKALEVYKEVAAKFPSNKYAKKASDRAEKLSKAQ